MRKTLFFLISSFVKNYIKHMCKLFAILFFGIIAKFTVNYKTSEERILVSVSGSCHFIKGKLTCVNPDYKCTIING